jgi:hypothetical protein
MLRWVIFAVAILAIWTSCYIWIAWTRGLAVWLIGVDLLLTALMCLAIGKLVPPGTLPSTLNWVTNAASMAVVAAQLAGRPAFGVPAGLVVAASIVTGTWLAHRGYEGIRSGSVLALQDVAAAAVMAIAMRAERTAVSAFNDLEEAEQIAALASARREEERALSRFVHNGPLTVLSMALHASDEQASAMLTGRATAVLAALPRMTGEPNPDASEVGLDGRLAQAVVWYNQQLTITAELQPCSVPADVAEAFSAAAAEALENVVRHAETARAKVTLRDRGDVVMVTVSDDGRGFDAAEVPDTTFGLREDLAGRIAAAGGTASVESAPGAGTVVLFEWRRG